MLQECGCYFWGIPSAWFLAAFVRVRLLSRVRSSHPLEAFIDFCKLLARAMRSPCPFAPLLRSPGQSWVLWDWSFGDSTKLERTSLLCCSSTLQLLRAFRYLLRSAALSRFKILGAHFPKTWFGVLTLVARQGGDTQSVNWKIGMRYLE